LEYYRATADSDIGAIDSPRHPQSATHTMGKFFFWLVWILEIVLFAISGVCVMMYISFEGAVGLTLLFVACGIAMLIGLRMAFTSHKEQVKPSRLAWFLTIPLIAAFIGYGACFALL
jgi:hypothetical protein